jgi:hypothetical protein
VCTILTCVSDWCRHIIKHIIVNGDVVPYNGLIKDVVALGDSGTGQEGLGALYFSIL